MHTNQQIDHKKIGAAQIILGDLPLIKLSHTDLENVPFSFYFNILTPPPYLRRCLRDTWTLYYVPLSYIILILQYYVLTSYWQTYRPH